MPKIPLFQERAEISAQAAGAQARGADVTSQALGQLGGVVSDIGIQMAQRMGEAKKKAEVADYKVKLKQWKNSLADAEVAALTDVDNPARFDEVYDRVYAPAIEGFRQEIGGYSKDIQQEFDLEIEDIKLDQQNKVRKSAIADYSIRLRDSMWQDMLEDTKEGRASADETFNDLVGLVGPEEAQRWRRRGEYNRELNIINSLNTPEEIDSYQIVSDDPGHMQALKTQKANRKNAIVAEAKTDYLGTTAQVRKAIKEGELSEQAINAYEAAGGSKKTADNLRRSVELASASDNKRSIKKGYDIVDAFKDAEDPTTMDDAIGDIMALNLSLSTKSKMVDDVVKSSEIIGSKSSIYNVPTGIGAVLGWKSVDVQTVSGYNSQTDKRAHDEWRNIYTEALSLARGEKEYNATIDLMMESRDRLIALEEKYPNGMNDKEWAEESSSVLGDIAGRVAKSFRAPQIETAKTSNEKPPKEGAIRAPDGRWVLQENGQWYEVTQ